MSEEYQTHRIWDWSLRLFHWSLAILIALMWWTADQGDMELHRKLGLAVLGLIVYRIFWGFFGPSTARFSKLPIKPKQILGYLPELRAETYYPQGGHNPLASLAVIAMLAAVTFQVSTGLFAIDVDGLESGPLARFISFDTGRDIADLHELSFNVILGLIILHLTALAYYALALTTDLVSAMITGKRDVKTAHTGPDPQAKANPLKVLAGLAVAGGVIILIQTIGI
ncbi:MAG: cytochrome b/b6 domain-containing protein [Pseudomonadota bacterium]